MTKKEKENLPYWVLEMMGEGDELVEWNENEGWARIKSKSKPMTLLDLEKNHQEKMKERREQAIRRTENCI
jgi:hypothetical protein